MKVSWLSRFCSASIGAVCGIWITNEQSKQNQPNLHLNAIEEKNDKSHRFLTFKNPLGKTFPNCNYLNHVNPTSIETKNQRHHLSVCQIDSYFALFVFALFS